MRKIVSIILVAVLMLGVPSVYATDMEGCDSERTCILIENQIIDSISAIASSCTVSTYDAYYLNDAFVCTLVESDGNYEFAYNLNNKLYYKKYVNGILVQAQESDNDGVEIAATVEQEIALNNIINNREITGANKEVALHEIGYKEIVYNGISCYVLNSPFPSRSIVHVGLDEVVAAFPEQIAEYSSTQPFYCPFLLCYKNIIVRDTRTNYATTQAIDKDLLAGTAVVLAAASILATPTSLLAWLGLALSVTSLPSTVSVSRTSEARAYRYRYGETYDTTNYNSYVTSSSEWGYDYFVLSDQGSDFAWGIKYSPTPLAMLYPDSTIAQNAADAYNNKLELFGLWWN